MGDYKNPTKIKKSRRLLLGPMVRDTSRWFDGAAVSTKLNSGVGGVIMITEYKIFKWYFNCGSGTNTNAELLGVWALLTLVVRLDISEIFVQGDSKIVID
jgi:ribonuclease HI